MLDDETTTGGTSCAILGESAHLVDLARSNKERGVVVDVLSTFICRQALPVVGALPVLDVDAEVVLPHDEEQLSSLKLVGDGAQVVLAQVAIAEQLALAVEPAAVVDEAICQALTVTEVEAMARRAVTTALEHSLDEFVCHHMSSLGAGILPGNYYIYHLHPISSIGGSIQHYI